MTEGALDSSGCALRMTKYVILSEAPFVILNECEESICFEFFSRHGRAWPDIMPEYALRPI